jgi:uncharacterized protein (TIGR00369 family)
VSSVPGIKLPEGTNLSHFPPALMHAMGLVEVVSLDKERGSRLRFEPRLEFTHSNGTTVQGGFITAWLDCSMAWAVHAHSPGASLASLDIQVRFISRVGPQPCYAQARVVKWGRTVAVLEADLLDPEGKLLARATSTGMVGSRTG